MIDRALSRGPEPPDMFAFLNSKLAPTSAPSEAAVRLQQTKQVVRDGKKPAAELRKQLLQTQERKQAQTTAVAPCSPSYLALSRVSHRTPTVHPPYTHRTPTVHTHHITPHHSTPLHSTPRHPLPTTHPPTHPTSTFPTNTSPYPPQPNPTPPHPTPHPYPTPPHPNPTPHHPATHHTPSHRTTPHTPPQPKPASPTPTYLVLRKATQHAPGLPYPPPRRRPRPSSRVLSFAESETPVSRVEPSRLGQRGQAWVVP